ncbi:hypothetical protein [Microvirga sp. P5_D2]
MRHSASIVTAGGMTILLSTGAAANPVETYIERIEKLEQRLVALEASLANAQKQLSAAQLGTAKQRQRSISKEDDGPQKQKPSAPQVSNVNSASPNGVEGNRPVNSESSPSKEDEEAIQELYLDREKAVALTPGKFEMAFEGKYIRSDTPLQFSRAFAGILSLRAGVANGVEVAGYLPVFQTNRRTETSAGPVEREITSIGDIGLQVNATVLTQKSWLPGVVLLGGVSLPTGPTFYAPVNIQNIGTREGQPGNPLDPFEFAQSTGHTTFTGGVQFFRTFEPFIFFGGLTYSHSLTRDIQGQEIQPGDRYTYNLGFGFAVSERTTIGAQVVGSIEQQYKVDSLQVRGASSEALAARFTLVQRVMDNYYFEPSLTIGLTDDAPDAVLSIVQRYTF